MNNYTLGIDMGVSSIGWACVSEKKQKIDSGVRIFPAGLDKFNSSKETHPNVNRRTARSMRRRIRRKADRKESIKKILQQLDWMPSAEAEINQWNQLEVYQLRSKALSEKISLLEFGRIILHLNQRRGFLSLRKKDEANADKDTQGMLGEMNELQKKIDASGHQTLGNYLHHLYLEDRFETPNKKIAHISRIRNRHIRRSMLHQEFSLIWQTQAQFHTELTDQLRYGQTGKKENPIQVVEPIPREKNTSLVEQFGIENLTFFQRKVYWKESSIGNCEWEENEKRAPVADLRFQEFRLLQEVNNLKILDMSNPRNPIERNLFEDERTFIISYLTGRKEVTFATLKNQLIKQTHLKDNLPDSKDQFSFNLESGGRTKISATPIEHLMAGNKALGKDWNKLDSTTKNQIIEVLTNPKLTDDELREELIERSLLSSKQANQALNITLPTGYCHLSAVFLDKVLPYMRKGLLYMAKDETNSATHAAGYKRRDEQDSDLFDILPPFEQITRSQSKFYQPHQVEINNPVVLRSLTELRKVVNAIIRKHGKPSRIHLEMARDLKMSPKQRNEHQKKNNKLEKERLEAAKEIEKLGIVATRDAIEVYRLWQEQDQQCIYSGDTLAIHQLFNGEVDVDHIFPYSQSADNSYFNKVVCLPEENRQKGNRHPYLWLAHADPEKYESILQRAKKLQRGKFKKFIAEEIPEGFANRDLNDTAWMTKAARQYLSLIMKKNHDILCIKGAHTSTLRNQWELHSLLRNDGIDLKTRDDHRHHALDAIVIALCDQSRIKEATQKLKHELRCKELENEDKKIFRLKTTGERLTLPWQDFRLDVAASLNAIWVSHRPKRKISGALHKETNYGKTKDDLLVVRKSIQNLSKKDLSLIRDQTTKTFLNTYIQEKGGDMAALKEISEDSPLLLPSGIPLRKVRIAFPYAHLTLKEGTPQQTHVQSASTHHLAIFTLGDGKFHFEPVTLFEASRRLKAGEEVIQKYYDNMPPETEFLFHLCTGDSMMAEVDGKEQLFIFKTMATTSGQVWFAYHTDATQGNKDPDTGKATTVSCKAVTFSKNFANAYKVNILPDGSVRNCY